MKDMIARNRMQYQRQLLQGVIQNLDCAKQQFMNYRSQVSIGYDAVEMHYLMVSMNKALQQLYQMQQESSDLLEQFRFVERSLG